MSRFVFLGVLLCLLTTLAGAATTDAISYQGVVTGPGGAAVNDGSYQFRFSLWTAATNGTSVWSETTSVLVNDGQFNAALGAGAAIPITVWRDNPDLWLQVEADINVTGLDAGDVFGPRTPIRAAGLALYAKDSARLGGQLASIYARDADLDATATAVSSITADVVSLEGRADTVESTVNGLSTSVLGLQGNASFLTNALTLVQEDVAALESDLDTHTHDDLYAQKLNKLVTVSSGGTPVENGAALLESVVGLLGPAVILVGPGTFELGTNTLVLPNSVDLVGHGYGRTTISRGSGAGVIVQSGVDSELRGLEIATASPAGMVGVLVDGLVARLRDVRINLTNAGAGASHIGVRLTGSGNLTMTGCEILVQGVSDGGGSFVGEVIGIQNEASTAYIRLCDVTARNGVYAAALRGIGAVEMRLVAVRAAGNNSVTSHAFDGSNSNLLASSCRFESTGGLVASTCIAVNLLNGIGTTIENCVITAGANGGTRAGIGSTGNTATIRGSEIRCTGANAIQSASSTLAVHQTILSGTNAVSNGSGNVRLAVCQLDGALIGPSTRFQCYNQNFAAVP